MAAANLLDFNNIFSLEGKIVVITGSSKGLGLAAASGMLQAGASKVYITSRTAIACEEACAELNKLPNLRPGSEAISVPGDSSTVEGIQQIVDAVNKTTHHVDILVANAGGTTAASIEDAEEKEFSKVLDLNIKGVFFLIQRFLPLLKVRATAENSSRIIVTSSVGGLALANIGENGTFAYAAAKAGVIHLVRQLAVELGPRHILTNSIAPGYFVTDAAAPFIKKYGGEEAMAATYPNGRLGRGEDFAGTAVFLASRASGHINGQCIVVDGGGIIGRVGQTD